jgi:hypothetical protein
MPLLPIGLLQASSTGFAIVMTGSFIWGKEIGHIHNREIRGALTLGGYCLVKKRNNLQTVGENNRRDDGEGAQLGRSI